MHPINPLRKYGLIPDALVRASIRHQLSKKLRKERHGDLEERDRHFAEFRATLDASPIVLQAPDTEGGPHQAPMEFYRQVFGPRLKSSSGYWSTKHTTFAESEEAMFVFICERAGLKDGQKILELDSDWGALTFWMAEHFPNASITTRSHSYRQHLHIEAEAQRREFCNIRVITADMNTFSAPEPGSYDRVILGAMWEIKNYRELLRRVAEWLKPGGKLFVQMLTHREYVTHFKREDFLHGIAHSFFSNGTIPSHNLLLYYQEDLKIQQHWKVSGNHYARTAEAWLQIMDGNKKTMKLILQKIYGRAEAQKRLISWRTFLMFCAELWSTRKGEEWITSIFLFEK